MGNIVSCCFCKSWCKNSRDSIIILNYSLNNVNLDEKDRKNSEELIPENFVLNYSSNNANHDENKRKHMDDVLEHQLCETDRKKSEELIPENTVLKYSLNNVNLDENELKRMDDFLVHQLYENELKQKRSDEELQCITKAVKNIVAKLMIAVGTQNSMFEISDQYLVGSMAEGTSIGEPHEFDFLVVLKHYSKPGAVRFNKNYPTSTSFKIYNGDLSVNLLQNGQIKLNSKTNQLNIEKDFLTRIIESEIKSLLSVVEKSVFGTLSIRSTVVCHHGPASVIKLVWKPTFTHSRELDILVDITPCIEQKGINSVIKASELPSTQTYKYLKEHDTYLMTRGTNFLSLFNVSLTILEVDIVKECSHNHKLGYMILKYCLNNIIYQYKHPFPSFCIKTFVIRHARQCTNIVQDDKETLLSLFTCIMDIFKDIGRNVYTFKVDGIFLTYDVPFRFNKNILTCFDNILNSLIQLGLNGYYVAHYNEFTEDCNLQSIDSRVQERVEYMLKHNIECHLCHLHSGCSLH